MNIFKWLKSKSGKLPISLAQAAGLTAVVGAAGFAAMSYLNSPTDNTTAFIPPSVYEQQGDVVYISQNAGGGRYESNGEVGSSFKALPSRSIQLANQQALRDRQAQELEEANVQPAYAGQEAGAADPSLKAFQLSGGELGLGMGSTGDKQGQAALTAMSNLQNQLANVSNAITSAQANAAAGAKAPGAPAGSAPGKGTSGQTAAQLANAPRNWGQGGGGASGVSNSFAIQNSGRNATQKEVAAGLAQAGNVMADAQAALANMQKEGSRMRSRANFGPSDGLGKDRDGEGTGSRVRYGNAKSELEWIRKQSSKIAANNANAANAGGQPFLASAKITGGIRVEGDVTTGQGASSGDLSTTDKQMRGVKAKLGQIQSNLEERTKKRHEMRKWMWIAFPLALVAIPLIARLRLMARIYKASIFTFALGIAMDILATIALIAALIPVAGLLLSSIKYLTQYGGDGSSIFATSLGGILAAGLAASFFIPAIGEALAGVTNWVLMAGGAIIGLGGATAFKFLSEKGDGYTDEQLDDNKSKDSLEDEEEKQKQQNN